MGKSQDNSDRLVNRIPSNRGQNVLEVLAKDGVLIDDYEEILRNDYLSRRISRLLKSKRQRFPDLYDVLDPKMEHGFSQGAFSSLQHCGITRYFELFSFSGEDMTTPEGVDPLLETELTDFWNAHGRIFPSSRKAWKEFMEAAYLGEIRLSDTAVPLMRFDYFEEYVPEDYPDTKSANPLARVNTLEDVYAALRHPDFLTWPRIKDFDIACAIMMAHAITTR